MWNKVQETVKFLQEKGFSTPDFGIVLGSGLGNLIAIMQVEVKIPYNEIPNFKVSTVAGHSGNLYFGTISGKKVVVQQGRFHFYEGWSMQDVTFPIRVMKFLGTDNLIVSNASGGVNKNFKVGDIMLITDQISFLMENPLLGVNEKRFGVRFVDMHEAYSKKMISKMVQVAKNQNILLKKGVYVGVTGPTFETPSEYRMIRNLGGDAVGMSTVPEVIVAKHMKMNCFGLSVITDLGVEGKVVSVSHEEVQKAAKEAEKTMRKLMVEFLASL